MVVDFNTPFTDTVETAFFKATWLFSTQMVVPPLPPPPAGVAHVPSPRQNVDDVAPVPESKFVTGKLPVTSEVKST